MRNTIVNARLILVILLAMATVGVSGSRDGGLSEKATLVFDGAEGFGVETRAGNGGDTLRVVNLDDSGWGSLRWAVERAGPRVVVFEVAGLISLASPLNITKPYLSILGQTAPSPGITLRHYDVAIRTHDVLIRHIRIRVGDLGRHADAGVIDGIKVLGSPRGGFQTYNVVVDHCSISWSIDELMSIWYENVHDVTFSHCLFSEALNESKHGKGPHAFGPIIGRGTKRFALLHSLIAHCSARTPDLTGGTETLVVNNVIYDPMWIFMGIHNLQGDPRPTRSSIIGNVCIKGPSARGPLNRAVYLYAVDAATTTLYVADNICEDCKEDPLSQIELKDPNTGEMLKGFEPALAPPTMCDHLTVHSSDTVYENVLSNAGARPWDRDAVDRRIIEQVRTRSGGLIDSQDDVGGWGEWGH